jgi:hypothetical protein
MTITLTLTVQATGRTALTLSKSMTVDAIDEVQVEVPHGASDQLINISPGDTDANQLTLIYSDTYPATVPGTPDLTYKPHSIAGSPISMSTFHLYMPDMDAAIPAGLDLIYVSNAHAAMDANLTILCGRNLS